MQIVILQGAFFPVPPVLGGAVEKIWYRMGQEFGEMGHDVIHIGRSITGLPTIEKKNSVTYIRVKGFSSPSSAIKLKLYDLIYTIRAIKHIPSSADVIVTNTFWGPLLLRGKIGAKVYVDIQRVPRGQMKFYTHVGVLRACSPAIAEAIEKEISPAVTDLISYIPNPVPFDTKCINKEKEKVILFVGRLHPEKGVDVLIKAFDTISHKLKKDWKLIIVGPHEFANGGGGQDYFQQLLSLSGSKQIEFLGPIFDEDQLALLYAKASIFCYPAQEGSGDAAPVAPREAMAYGCVPVVSRLGCFSDFITDKKNGITYDHLSIDQVLDLSNIIAQLIVDEKYVQKLAKEAKHISESFAAKVIATSFIKDFKNKIICKRI